MAWEIEFFEGENGSYPVEEFLDSLPKKHKQKVLALVDMLREEGHELRFPLCSHVQGKLFELRTQFGKTRYRILYYCDIDRAFVLLHGLAKRTEKLPERDRRIALRRMAGDIIAKRRE